MKDANNKKQPKAVKLKILLGGFSYRLDQLAAEVDAIQAAKDVIVK